MADPQRTTQVHRTVRRVNRYWYRAGVPRRVRRDKGEELHAHLLEAVENGRDIEEVVGRDLAAFASEWAQAERPRPLLDLSLQVVAMMTLLPGGLALLNPWLSTILGDEDPRTGVPVRLLAYLAVIIPVIIGWQLLRVRRHRLTSQQTAILGVLLLVGYTALYVLLVGPHRDTEALAVMPPSTAWTLVIVGAVTQGAASWLKRSRQG